MHPSVSTSYIVPAILLNPVLFLMSINTILSRILPPIWVDAAVQPPPYTMLGPSPEHPHLDIHESDCLCWGYTILIVCAQLVAFGRVSGRREEGKVRARAKARKQRDMAGVTSMENKTLKDVVKKPRQINDLAKHGDTNTGEDAYEDHDESDLESDLASSSNDGSDVYTESTDSEVIR